MKPNNAPQARAQTELKQCLQAIKNKKPAQPILSEQSCRQLARHIQALLRKQPH